ncbi:MAG TPA: glutaminyl-peptide cyclotransferase [Chitinophagaceae bacterium]|nr:glutaminyl-peptide cyclotransferase [Chitinophagaceae bacterium]
MKRTKLARILAGLILVTALAIFILCNRKKTQPVIKKEDGPSAISYSIMDTFPHDTSSFTQGLIIYNGSLYEGTGEPGRSKLMKVNLKTGKMERQIKLDDKYFGEGITILHDTVYQLTWQDKVVFVYTLKDFRKVKEFPIKTEGWGITTDGNQLIVSDGTSELSFYEPSTFRLVKTQTVSETGAPTFNLNELEYINGYVYANMWQYAYILKIDPATGKVVAKADLTQVWDRVKVIDPQADVPNGIAYDTATKKMYVTGKLWPELYEIQFSQ